MFESNKEMEQAHQISRLDVDDPLSSCSGHPIVLENRNWTTCEHYTLIKTIRSQAHAETIDNMQSAQQAIKFASRWYRFKIKNHKKLLPVLMTRALYIKVQMYEQVKMALLATEDKLIIETSQYDYFWGIGRDLRGHNHLGKIWMNIRDKVKDPNHSSTLIK